MREKERRDRERGERVRERHTETERDYCFKMVTRSIVYLKSNVFSAMCLVLHESFGLTIRHIECINAIHVFF